MREIKLKPILLSFIVVLVLLAAGSFTYQYVAQQKPLEQALKDMHYSEMTNPIRKVGGIYELEIEPIGVNKLIDAVNEITDVMVHNNINREQYVIKVNREATGDLQSIWQDNLFEITEIMANENYSELPILMNQIQEEHKDITAIADIDVQNVYVTLSEGDKRLDVILPLDGGKMEVWSNEK